MKIYVFRESIVGKARLIFGQLEEGRRRCKGD